MLVDRLRYPRTRADELAQLRARFSAQPGRLSATPEQIELAERMRALRIELAAAFGEVEECRRCARGHPLPHGRWNGGHCCGGQTLTIWSAPEVAALKLGGTKARELTPPAGDHAGCVFRGPTGCSLAPADRPNLCVRFLCISLRAELLASPAWPTISALAAELARTQRRFEALLEE